MFFFKVMEDLKELSEPRKQIAECEGLNQEAFC